MKIRGERARIAQRVAGRFVLAAGEMFDELARVRMELGDIAVVDRIGAAAPRHLHVFAPQNKLVDALVEGKNVDARTGSINELRAGTEEDVARDDLLVAGPQDVVDSDAVAFRPLADGKNRP